MIGIEIRVKGKVQGVGFRPFVWQIAHQLEIKGEVLNDKNVYFAFPKEKKHLSLELEVLVLPLFP